MGESLVCTALFKFIHICLYVFQKRSLNGSHDSVKGEVEEPEISIIN